MITLVLDASVAIDWFCISPEGSAYSRPLEDIAIDDRARFRVPLHFDVEVARTLRKQHKNHPQAYSRAWLTQALQILDRAPLDIVAQGINFALLGELSLAYNLDIPDVPYLHLARTMSLPIATRDRGLISACKAWHVEHWQPVRA